MEKAFTKPYENGWGAKPAENSWVTPQIMDAYDEAINTIDDRVIGQSEDLTQFIDDGFLPKNKWKTNPLNLSASVGVNFDNTLKQGTYIIKTFDASTSGVFNFFGVTPSGNEAILSGVSWANTINGIVFTTTKDYESLRFYSSANFSGKVQIEEGTEAHQYTPYAPSNIELKENLTQMQTNPNWLVKHTRFSATTSANGNVGFTGLRKAYTLPIMALAYDADASSGHYPCLIYSYASSRTWVDVWGCKVVNELSSPEVKAVTTKNVIVHVWYLELNNENNTY